MPTWSGVEIDELTSTGVDRIDISVCAVRETDRGDVQICGESHGRSLPRTVGRNAFTISVSHHINPPSINDAHVLE